MFILSYVTSIASWRGRIHCIWSKYINKIMLEAIQLWLKTMLVSCDSHVWVAYNGVGVLTLYDAKTSVISWITLSLILHRMEGCFQKRCI